MTDDLWPDDIGRHIKLKAPVSILKEQGTLLGRKTGNLVKGVINIVISSDKDHFAYIFYLVAPALGDYHYRLLEVSHSVDLYPLGIETDEDVLMELPVDVKAYGEMRGRQPKPILVADSQDRFIEILRAIFATKKVRRVIEAIIAQSGVTAEVE